MLTFLKNFFRDEEGQDMIEYALLASFISIVAITIIMLIAEPLIAIYQAILTALG